MNQHLFELEGLSHAEAIVTQIAAIFSALNPDIGLQPDDIMEVQGGQEAQ